MTDFFLLLDQPRRPWLEAASLEAVFLERSAAEHPDRFHESSPDLRRRAQDRFTELNAAFQCLKESKSRVLHLLRLESGRDPAEVQEIPHGTTDLFMQVAQLSRQVDLFLKGTANLASPILKARAFQDGQGWMEKVRHLQSHLQDWRNQLEAELKSLNSDWEKAPPVGKPGRLEALPLTHLERIYRLLSYRERWAQQLQERLFLLTQ